MAAMSLVLQYNFWLLFIAIGLYAPVNLTGNANWDSLASTWHQIGLDYGKVRLIGSAA